jgi:replication-associated recombination protein RarA
VPQPEDIIKSTSKDTIEQLKEVNEKVIPLFEDAADMLIKHHKGDARKALCSTLALLSGYHKEEMSARSLLTGQEDQVTF